MSERFSIGFVEAHESSVDGVLTPVITGDAGIYIDEYSKFKYGDGAAAEKFGQTMASLLLDAHPGLLEQDMVYVTSSAYKVAPPAANALLGPFVGRADSVARQLGCDTSFEPFKIHRQTLTNGDYATMDEEERRKVMAANELSLPAGIDFAGNTVVALDDICVTGSHEQAVERVLASAELDSLYHSYVLSVDGGTQHPNLEAAINATSINSINDIVSLSQTSEFIPNARLCKHILSQPLSDVATFCQNAPSTVVAQVCEYIKGDELDKMEKYRETYKGLIAIIVDSEVDSLLTDAIRA